MTAEDSWESVVLDIERSKQQYSKLGAHLETLGDYYSEIGDWLTHGAMSISEDSHGNRKWRNLPREQQAYEVLPPIAECVHQVNELRNLSARIDELEKRKQRLEGAQL